MNSILSFNCRPPDACLSLSIFLPVCLISQYLRSLLWVLCIFELFFAFSASSFYASYDSQTFKLGPLSCMICHALLFDSAKCVPCSPSFCKQSNARMLALAALNRDVRLKVARCSRAMPPRSLPHSGSKPVVSRRSRLTHPMELEAGRKPTGKGVYQYVDKYGANVDGYSPIYSPEEWSPSGDTYAGVLEVLHQKTDDISWTRS